MSHRTAQGGYGGGGWRGGEHLRTRHNNMKADAWGQ